MPSAALARTTLTAAAGSHAGLQRENNEDRYHCDPQRGIFFVVDGVGGHAAGEKAAETALTLIRARLERETGSAADRVREAITLANNEIFRLGGTEPSWAGMACVLTVTLVREGRVTVGHVGDTRLYAFSRGGVKKVTHDHSPVGEREDQGELDELEAMRHPRRNEIYRDVGSQHHEPGDEEFIETIEFPFEPDTALLLCTDGLSDMVPSARMAQIVAERAADPALVVERLIEAANAAGGKDNVTAVIVTGPAFVQAVGGGAYAAGGNGVSTASRPTAGASWAGKLALVIYGVAAGLAIAGGLLFFSDAVTDRAMGVVRPAGWNKTWYVGPGEYHDFASIQEALTRAQPGDVVEVDNGGYDLPIVLPAGVDLVARRPREAILRVPPGAAPASRGIQVAGQSRLSGFKVDASGVEMAIAAGEGEMLLEDLEVLGASKAGVIFGARSRGTLRASHLHDNAETAVVVASGALPRLLHNVIAGNGKGPAAAARPANGGGAPHGAVPAVVLQQGASATFFGNIIAGNGDDQVAGLPAEKRADLVRDNVVGTPQPQRPPAPARPRRQTQ